MSRHAAHTAAPPDVVWRLLARPEHWPDWSPHVRGAWGLAGPDGWVREGARGAARLLGVVPVPARITAVEEGRSWTWRVGVVDMEHRVERDPGGGCTVAVTLSAPGAVQAVVAAAYAPVVALMMRNLARVGDDVVAARGGQPKKTSAVA
ncbi:MAG TPA: SRPBCC family protein [Baekduia sp.]|nr:SRPBCC family protein [Baekduia sp.]